MQKIISTCGLLAAAPALFAQVALKADFERNAGYLYSKTGTAKVTASPTAHGGKKVMQFTASGKTAVLTSGTMLSNQVASPIVRLSFFARGKEIFQRDSLTVFILAKANTNIPPMTAKKKSLSPTSGRKSSSPAIFGAPLRSVSMSGSVLRREVLLK